MGTRIYVGNLSFDSTEDSIAQAFGQDSRKVKNVSIVTDRDTGRPRGFAFVEMESEPDARAAIEALDGVELDGRTLRVNEAQERQPRPSRGQDRNRRW
jgi:RNA recognition motif-containing protein